MMPVFILFLYSASKTTQRRPFVAVRASYASSCAHNLLQLVMVERRNRKLENLEKVLCEVEEGKLSGRAAAAKYLISRITLNDH